MTVRFSNGISRQFRNAATSLVLYVAWRYQHTSRLRYVMIAAETWTWTCGPMIARTELRKGLAGGRKDVKSRSWRFFSLDLRRLLWLMRCYVWRLGPSLSVFTGACSLCRIWTTSVTWLLAPALSCRA